MYGTGKILQKLFQQANLLNKIETIEVIFVFK